MKIIQSENFRNSRLAQAPPPPDGAAPGGPPGGAPPKPPLKRKPKRKPFAFPLNFDNSSTPKTKDDYLNPVDRD